MMRFPRLFGRHATLQDLLRLVDGAAPNAERLRAHLAACTDCRLELQRLRSLSTAAEEMDGPLPSEDLLAKIHQRVAAGEAVLLPVTADAPAADRRPQSRGLARLATVAAAAAVIVVGSVFLWPDTKVEAGALSGELSLAPSAPRPGDSVEVAFRAAPLLAGEERLVLRGRYRTTWDAPYNHGTHQQRVAILHRGKDGVHRGAFRLPDDVVYATFAVEDTAAARIDSRGRRLWELVVTDSAGRPLPEIVFSSFRSEIILASAGMTMFSKFFDFKVRGWRLFSRGLLRPVQRMPAPKFHMPKLTSPSESRENPISPTTPSP